MTFMWTLHIIAHVTCLKKSFPCKYGKKRKFCELMILMSNAENKRMGKDKTGKIVSDAFQRINYLFQVNCYGQLYVWNFFLQAIIQDLFSMDQIRKGDACKMGHNLGIFFFNFCGDSVTILCNHWYSLFRTSVHSTHGLMHHRLHSFCLFVIDPQGQLWLPKPRPGPNFTPWYGEATPRVTTQCHFQDCWQIRTQDLMAQSPVLYQLSYPAGLRFVHIQQL